MTLTENVTGQGQRLYYMHTSYLESIFDDSSNDDLDGWSKSQVKVKFSQNLYKRITNSHILDAISSTEFIRGTKVLPNWA